MLIAVLTVIDDSAYHKPSLVSDHSANIVLVQNHTSNLAKLRDLARYRKKINKLIFVMNESLCSPINRILNSFSLCSLTLS